MPADYINDLNKPVSIDPSTTALVVVDLQYATGSPYHGLGKMLRDQGRLDEADYRFSRINNLVLPNTQRLLKAFRESGARIVYVTYGAEL